MDRQNEIDDYWMSLALEQAENAAEVDEVPVGAVLIDKNNELIAEGYNQPIRLNDPTAHAEIVVLRKAGDSLKNYRLPGTTLYVTLEPCTMCVGALVQARVKRIVYGALEPKAGAIESVHCLFDHGFFNHLPLLTGGVLAQQSSILLSTFFENRRRQKRKEKSG